MTQISMTENESDRLSSFRRKKNRVNVMIEKLNSENMILIHLSIFEKSQLSGDSTALYSVIQIA